MSPSVIVRILLLSSTVNGWEALTDNFFSIHFTLSVMKWELLQRQPATSEYEGGKYSYPVLLFLVHQ
jgi:hypothetical protein